MANTAALKTAALMSEAEALLAPFDDELISLALDIHAHPQIRFEETHAAAVLTDSAEAHGFQVERGIAGMATAFIARYRNGDHDDAPTVAIFCEYDALEGIGHCCGHNIIAAAGLGGGLVAKAWLQAHPEVPANLLVIGSPGEEGGGGKIPIIEAGYVEGVAAALMVHPGGSDERFMPSLGRNALDVDFIGQAAHASASPWEGRNALDAATLAWAAIGMLRQQLTDDVRVHGIITDGGQAPNIIVQHTSMRIFCRAADADGLVKVVQRVSDCINGAALAAGVQARIVQNTPPYLPLIDNAPLLGIVDEVFNAQGRPAPQHGEGMGACSTDMGNVSHLVPAIHPVIAIGENLVLHTAELATAAVGERMAPAVRDGAVMLAVTALAVLTDADLRRETADDFAASDATGRTR